jgi:hypothetical protein
MTCRNASSDTDKKIIFHRLLLLRNDSWIFFLKHSVFEITPEKTSGVSLSQNVNFKFQPPAKFPFLAKVVTFKVVHPLKAYYNTKFHGPTLLVQMLHPPQKFERPPFWNGCSYGIKHYGIEVTFNGMTSLNFIQFYHLVQNFMGGGHTDGVVISSAYFFPLEGEAG